MRYPKSVSQLKSWGISEITKGLRRERLSLNKIDSLFIPDSGDYVEFTPYWTITERDTGRQRKTGEIKVYIRKDKIGLYLDFNYFISYEGGQRSPVSLRYDLVKRESNLLQGTFRYYIKDPYSSLKGDGLCTRLYFIPEIGEFVPRSILNSYGVLYSQQRKGHKDRYFFPEIIIPESKYRKTQYKGKETPFGRRSRELQEKKEYRDSLFFVGLGLSSGLISQEEEDLLREYCRITGRKTLPRASLFSGTKKATFKR